MENSTTNDTSTDTNDDFTLDDIGGAMLSAKRELEATILLLDELHFAVENGLIVGHGDLDALVRQARTARGEISNAVSEYQEEWTEKAKKRAAALAPVLNAIKAGQAETAAKKKRLAAKKVSARQAVRS